MPDELSKSTRIRLKVLGWYQVVGAVFGILVSVFFLLSTGALNGLTLLLCGLALLMYCFSVYCGLLLIELKHQRGLPVTIVNQILQSFSIFIAGYGYFYLAGFDIIFKLQAAFPNIRYNLDFGLASKWEFDFKSDDHTFSIGVNLIAILLIYFCYRLQQKIKEKTYFEASDYIYDSK